MAVTFFLRVFFHGLVAFVPMDDDAVVLLGKAHGHTPSIIVEECVGSCAAFTAVQSDDGRIFRVALLEGYDIEIAPFTLDDLGPSPLLRVPVKGAHLPLDSKDARSLMWLPEMSRILDSNQDSQIHSCYLKDPGGCRHDRASLAGRMYVRSGTLRTCQLVQSTDLDDVYSFEFKGYILGPDRHEQALTEIVDLTLDRTITADSVTLLLKNFAGKEVATVKLKPVECAGGPKGTMCVDIFIGNVPPRDDKDPHRVGHHFVHHYDLLQDKPVQFLPYRNFLRSIKGVNVQPACRGLPYLSARKSDQRGGHSTHRSLSKGGIRTAESRSVCPMVVLDPPPS